MYEYEKRNTKVLTSPDCFVGEITGFVEEQISKRILGEWKKYFNVSSSDVFPLSNVFSVSIQDVSFYFPGNCILKLNNENENIEKLGNNFTLKQDMNMKLFMETINTKNYFNIWNYKNPYSFRNAIAPQKKNFPEKNQRERRVSIDPTKKSSPREKLQETQNIIPPQEKKNEKAINNAKKENPNNNRDTPNEKDSPNKVKPPKNKKALPISNPNKNFNPANKNIPMTQHPKQPPHPYNNPNIPFPFNPNIPHNFQGNPNQFIPNNQLNNSQNLLTSNLKNKGKEKRPVGRPKKINNPNQISTPPLNMLKKNQKDFFPMKKIPQNYIPGNMTKNPKNYPTNSMINLSDNNLQMKTSQGKLQVPNNNNNAPNNQASFDSDLDIDDLALWLEDPVDKPKEDPSQNKPKNLNNLNNSNSNLNLIAPNNLQTSNPNLFSLNNSHPNAIKMSPSFPTKMGMNPNAYKMSQKISKFNQNIPQQNKMFSTMKNVTKSPISKARIKKEELTQPKNNKNGVIDLVGKSQNLDIVITKTTPGNLIDLENSTPPIEIEKKVSMEAPKIKRSKTSIVPMIPSRENIFSSSFVSPVLLENNVDYLKKLISQIPHKEVIKSADIKFKEMINKKFSKKPFLYNSVKIPYKINVTKKKPVSKAKQEANPPRLSSDNSTLNGKKRKKSPSRKSKKKKVKNIFSVAMGLDPTLRSILIKKRPFSAQLSLFLSSYNSASQREVEKVSTVISNKFELDVLCYPSNFDFQFNMNFEKKSAVIGEKVFPQSHVKNVFSSQIISSSIIKLLYPFSENPLFKQNKTFSPLRMKQFACNDEITILESPKIVIGHANGNVYQISPYNILSYFEKSNFSPIFGTKNVKFAVISLHNPHLEGLINLFFKDLSSVYQISNLGFHHQAFKNPEKSFPSILWIENKFYENSSKGIDSFPLIASQLEAFSNALSSICKNKFLFLFILIFYFFIIIFILFYIFNF